MLYIQALMKDQDTDVDYSKYNDNIKNNNEVINEKILENKKTENKLNTKINFNNKTYKNKTYKNKNSALLKAQDHLIKLCELKKESLNDILLKLKYVKNWSGPILNICCKEDDIIINENNKKLKFSKKKFLMNKFFRNKLSDKYSKELGLEVYIKIIKQKHDDDNFTIIVLTRR